MKMKKCKHTEGPVGYIQKMAWLEWMSKKYDQIRCPKCGLFQIWKRKTKWKAIPGFKLLPERRAVESTYEKNKRLSLEAKS